MQTYQAPDLARHLTRARDRKIRVKPTGQPLVYRATSSRTGEFAYFVRVAPDLMSAACDCDSRVGCMHGAAALSAARKEAAKQAARTMRRAQLWAKELASAA